MTFYQTYSVMWLIDKNRDRRQYHTGTDWLVSDIVKEVEALIQLKTG